MAELDGITVRVKAEVDDAIAKLRLLRDEMKALKDVKVSIKTDFDKAKAAIAATAAETKKLGSEIGKASRDTNGFGSSWRRLFADIKKGVGDAKGGILSKLGGGVKGWFKNIERGAKDTWKAVKDLGSAFSDVFKVMSGVAQEGMTLQKSFNNVGTAAAGVVAGLAEMGPGLIVVAAIVAALIIPIGALVSGLIAATGALAAGAIGIGLLAAVAIPAIKNLQAGMSQLSAATNAYSSASKNLNIGLKTSAQDMAQYQSVLKGVDPNLRGAVKLLRDSNVQWQRLSKSQRNSVVALSENKAALKAMSPAMAAALAALLKEKTAYDNLSPTQRRFAKALSGVSAEWRKVQQAAQPVITLLLSDLARLAKNVLPLVTPLINATGKAIDGLLKRAIKFVKSEQFKAWVKKLTAEIPGVIREVGNFISKLAALIGPILTNKKNLADLHNTLTTVVSILRNTNSFLNACSTAFNGLMHAASPVIGVLSAISGALGAVERAAAAAGNAISSVLGLGGGVGSGIAAGLGALGFADGTPGAPPGWAWTGERGPELVKFQGGETVIPHGPSMATARAYANGTPGWNAGDMRPIVVNVDGKKLFEIMQNRTFRYNVANGARNAQGGGVTGKLVPR